LGQGKLGERCGGGKKESGTQPFEKRNHIETFVLKPGKRGTQQYAGKKSVHTVTNRAKVPPSANGVGNPGPRVR